MLVLVDDSSLVQFLVGNCCFVAHLEEVKSFGLQVAALVTVAGHRADGVRDSFLDIITAGFRGLETLAALVGVHGFVLYQVGTNEALTEL